MTEKILKCFPDDTDSVWKIVNSCSKWLSNKGMDHWKGYYTRDIIADNIKNAETYGFFLDENMIGVGCLDKRVSDYYHEDYMRLCEDFSSSALYLNMLGVEPSSHERGVASKLLLLLEDKAREKGVNFLRFNAFTEYKELNEFYIKRDFCFLGSVVDEDGDEMSFYEKRLGKD